MTAQKTEREEALERFIEHTIRDVAELPDRSSPEDQPEMMLVTGDELEMILRDRLEASSLLFSSKAEGEMRQRIAELEQSNAFLGLVGGHVTWEEFLEGVKYSIGFEPEHLGHVMGKLAELTDQVAALSPNEDGK